MTLWNPKVALWDPKIILWGMGGYVALWDPKNGPMGSTRLYGTPKNGPIGPNNGPEGP